MPARLGQDGGMHGLDLPTLLTGAVSAAEAAGRTALQGFRRRDLAVVWDPPWHPRMISEEARQELGIDDAALED